MKEYLPFISIDVWEMIFTWVNFIILFLLLKKFLFRPISDILEKRGAEIEQEFQNAQNANEEAEQIKIRYERELGEAKNKSDRIIKTAEETAKIRSDKIIGEASQKAAGIIEKSRSQIECDKKEAVNAAKGEIALMAVMAAERLIGREISADDDDRLIADIIEKI